MNSDIILKAEDLHFSYDDDHSHSLNGLFSGNSPWTESGFYGSKRQRKIYLFSLLYRNPQTSVRKAVF